MRHRRSRRPATGASHRRGVGDEDLADARRLHRQVGAHRQHLNLTFPLSELLARPGLSVTCPLVVGGDEKFAVFLLKIGQNGDVLADLLRAFGHVERLRRCAATIRVMAKALADQRPFANQPHVRQDLHGGLDLVRIKPRLLLDRLVSRPGVLGGVGAALLIQAACRLTLMVRHPTHRTSLLRRRRTGTRRIEKVNSRDEVGTVVETPSRQP